MSEVWTPMPNPDGCHVGAIPCGRPMAVCGWRGYGAALGSHAPPRGCHVGAIPCGRPMAVCGWRGYGAALGSHAPPRRVPCRGDPLWSPDGGVRVARIRRSPRFPCPTPGVPTRDTPTPTCQMYGISTAPRVPFTSTVPYTHSPSSTTPTGDLLPHPSRVIKIVRPTRQRSNLAFTQIRTE